MYLTRKNDHFVQIIFQDNGCGFPDHVQRELFKPFFTTRAKGTGLGLTIVKKMLTSMRSTVNIEGETGKGARIIITLPSAESAECKAKTAA
jgi:signal transduction histidine kinase